MPVMASHVDGMTGPANWTESLLAATSQSLSPSVAYRSRRRSNVQKMRLEENQERDLSFDFCNLSGFCANILMQGGGVVGPVAQFASRAFDYELGVPHVVDLCKKNEG